jgi:glycosyltransferase involved in cell wall biosynthesis
MGRDDLAPGRDTMSRILMVCHGHPELSLGGGEIAAYRQCSALRAAGHDVLFLARAAPPNPHCGTPFSLALSHPQDVLFYSPDINHFLHSQRAKWAIYKQFRELIERFQPEVFHFHHYVHLGVEMLREARRSAPTAPIVLTLHEYLAICHNHGQMLKTNPPGMDVATDQHGFGGANRLCQQATPTACSACFPNYSPQDFFLRESYLRSFLDLADAFICPGKFLLERYAQWGLPREKLYLIDNGQPAACVAAEQPGLDLSRRFALLGQISELKGALVFLDAVAALPKRVRRGMVFTVHGSIQHGSEGFRAALAERLDRLGGHVRYVGEYRPDDLPALMARTGWVVVPSIWWENSPLVIQEAFSHRRPVICGNIGGMAEKVIDGRDGLHFIAGSPADLAARMEAAIAEGVWAKLQAGITPPWSAAQSLAAHLDLYAAIAAQRGHSEPRPSTSPTVVAVTRGRRVASEGRAARS